MGAEGQPARLRRRGQLVGRPDGIDLLVLLLVHLLLLVVLLLVQLLLLQLLVFELVLLLVELLQLLLVQLRTRNGKGSGAKLWSCSSRL
ncbi:hypothetical protein [Streptomyces zaomyceticus]|uniref:hypothetical protein n=1 Tax=Streptomyces zaomyceticus TaxID=68286 RepID=UPI00167872C6|nr:hypothetical protein [Streptomyces zaomyceticus]GHG13254.1 hypothetical protein GCM10018791_28740 [Streptomyces zaomyceticus]